MLKWPKLCIGICKDIYIDIYVSHVNMIFLWLQHIYLTLLFSFFFTFESDRRSIDVSAKDSEKLQVLCRSIYWLNSPFTYRQFTLVCKAEIVTMQVWLMYSDSTFYTDFLLIFQLCITKVNIFLCNTIWIAFWNSHTAVHLFRCSELHVFPKLILLKVTLFYFRVM